MAGSRIRTESDFGYVPARTCGPLGINDHGDPNVTTFLGDTPGSVGTNDYADPNLRELARLSKVPVGSVVRTSEGIALSVGSTVDKFRNWAVQEDKDLAYEFFAAFFDHYLPKKFLHHYVYDNGQKLTLTAQEMIDCNPLISIILSPDFNKVLKELFDSKGKRAGGTVKRDVNLRFVAGAMTNGTLGQFTVKMNGTLSYKSEKEWSVSGTMSFYDEWDFDVKDFKTGGRSVSGELKTRLAHYTLPGTGFKIDSETVPFTQTSRDKVVNWAGGTPEAKPDKVGQVDVATGNAGKSEGTRKP